MELRACNDTPISQDLIPPIPPIAAALHDARLRSLCSACFRPLPPSATAPIPCAACSAAILYCSPSCSSSDNPRHTSSGECRLLSLPSSSRPDDTADLRTALRLLHTLGLLKTHRSRIGGLLASGIGSGSADWIKQGAELMSRARGGDAAKAEVEEVALCAVLTNAVEVEVGEAGAIGIAVYGPRFSWFNHSCSPNACFRFELLPGSVGNGTNGVFPAGTDEALPDAWESWVSAESQLNNGLSHCGPRVVVRSIKPIKRGEEVCIAYTDLLQPKALRHSDLWSKYHFVCCCERCSASPQMYIDYILSCSAWSLNSDHDNSTETDCEEQSECVDQAITRYMSDGNPKTCCEKLEFLLSESFQDKQSQTAEPSQRKFKLHPLHYLSLSAYITLASTYRIQASSLLASDFGEENILEAFKMSRAAAAYSLLLLGATHHLFLCESSLVASVSLYVISAGESILHLVRILMRVSTNMTDEEKLSFVPHCSQHPMRESCESWDQFRATSMKFVECLSCILLKSWPYLTQGFPYLESMKSAINFSWLGISNITPQVLTGVIASKFGDQVCLDCNYTAGICIGEDLRGLIHLAIHCLFYGKYLADICYGSRCYLAEHADNLLHGIRQVLC